MEKLQVFISYKHHPIDGAIAQALYDLLREWGYDAWMDVHNIASGITEGSSGWISAIHQGIKQSHVIIGLISPESLQSVEVQNEWNWAYINKKRIFFIRLRDFDTQDIAPQFVQAIYRNREQINDLQADLQAYEIERAEKRAELTEAVTVPEERNLNEEILKDLNTLASQAPKKRPKRPIYESPLLLRVIALLIFIVGLLWLITDIGFEPLLLMLGSIIPLLASFAVSQNEPMIGDDKSEERDWLIFKDRTRRYWLESLLRPILNEAAALNIGLSAQPDMVIQHEELGAIDLSGGSMDVGGIFNALRSFLIVGEAGAGKTVMLLQLATKLLLHPPPDLPKCLPLLLNLSSWGNDDIPLDEWLLQEAEATYQIRRKTFSRWLNNKRLILLLDGLDEIRTDEADRRTMRDRIQKINDYREAHPDMPMVICTRIAEYRISTDDHAQHKLNFTHAIRVDPLTETQIRAYMDSPDLDSLRQLYAEDATVRQLAQIPFLLVTMTHTYRGLPKRQLEADDSTIPARQDHLFRKYLTKQLQSHAPLRHDEDKIRQYLTWIATKTTAFGTVFRADRVTIEWFRDDEHLMWLYQLLMLFIIPTRLRNLVVRWLILTKLPRDYHQLAHDLTARQILRPFGGGHTFRHDYLRQSFFTNSKIVTVQIQLLINDLADKEKRESVIEKILQFGNSAIEPLIARLGDRHYDEPWAIEAFRNVLGYQYHDISDIVPGVLAKIGKQAIEQLIAHLDDKNDYVRDDVSWALEKLEWQPQSDIQVLQFAFAKRDFDTLIDLKAIDFLIFYLNDLNSYVRNNIAKALEKLEWQPQDDDQKMLLVFAEQNFDKLVEMKAVDFLTARLGDKSIDVRCEVVKALGRIEDARAVEPLIARLGDWYVRHEMVWALGRIGDARAVEPLIARLSDKEWYVRYNVARALGQLGDARAVKPLLARLRDKDSGVRGAVAEALGRIGDVRAVKPLLARLRDESSGVRGAVAVALGQLGDARAVKPLIPLLKDTEKDWRGKKRVCDVAAEALRKIGTAEARQALRDAGFAEE